MKTLKLLIFALLSANISCSNSTDEETPSIQQDLSKAPDELKGTWKVDFQSLKSDPTWISSNNTNSFISFSDNNLLNYKDWYTGMNNEKAQYLKTSWGYSIQLSQIQISSNLSNIKPGYTEFHINYQYVPEKDNTLFAKKQ